MLDEYCSVGLHLSFTTLICHIANCLQSAVKASIADDTSLKSDVLSPSSEAIKLSKREVEDLRDAFRLFDADGKGVIR